MARDKEREIKLKELRKRAEKVAVTEQADVTEITLEDARNTLQELSIYQVELEMQNDELIRTNLELQNVTSRYLELYDFAPVAYLTISPEGIITQANLAAARLLGVDRRRLVNMGFTRFVHQDHHSAYYSCVTGAIESNNAQSCDLQLEKKDGAICHTRLEVIAVRKETTGTDQIWMTISDITEIQNAKEKLSKNEMEFRSLFEHMLTGVVYFKVLTDSKGQPEDLVYVRVNNAFEWMTGMKKVDVLGKKITEVFPDIKEMENNFIQTLGRVALTGEDYLFEQYFEPLASWFTGSAYRPEMDHCAVVLSDITNLKLTEANLIGAKDQLEKKNEELEAFVYTAAHDLRTPLTSAQGYFELVQHRIAGKLNKAEKGFMNMVPLSLYKLDSLLRDLLEFSKMVESSEPLYDVDIKGVIDRIEEEERLLINDVNASIKVEKNLPPVHIHETRLYQLFKNLISNSLKYARENVPLEVDISMSREYSEEEPSRYRVFVVKDNGIGINKDFADKIFDVFVQKEKVANSGSGVGLAIAKRIVDLAQGKIWAESTLGEGTVFYISLPVADEKGKNRKRNK